MEHLFLLALFVSRESVSGKGETGGWEKKAFDAASESNEEFDKRFPVSRIDLF